MKTRQIEELTAAIDKAKEEAELEKHERRMKRLQKAGHDTTHLKASFEGKKLTHGTFSSNSCVISQHWLFITYRATWFGFRFCK